MSIFILTCDNLRIFETFKDLDSVLHYLDKKNNADFDGCPFSIFGRGQILDYDENGESILINSSYFVDSVILSPKRDSNKYYTFYIRRINESGEPIEIDAI